MTLDLAEGVGSAHEQAPSKRFPLFSQPLSGDLLREIEKAKIARAPAAMRETVEALSVEISILRYVAGRARQRIGAAAVDVTA